MGGGAIPYRRNGGYAWFARAAFETDLESFFPGDEVIGLIEKHKIVKDGRISPEAESYITVIDDDFIGEICSGAPYDTFESSRGYDEVSLSLLEGSGDTLLIIEDISCEFRVSSYDWRRSTIGDFFRYRDGELRREGYTISEVGVGIDTIIGGVTSLPKSAHPSSGSRVPLGLIDKHTFSSWKAITVSVNQIHFL